MVQHAIKIEMNCNQLFGCFAIENGIKKYRDCASSGDDLEYHQLVSNENNMMKKKAGRCTFS